MGLFDNLNNEVKKIKDNPDVNKLKESVEKGVTSFKEEMDKNKEETTKRKTVPVNESSNNSEDISINNSNNDPNISNNNSNNNSDISNSNNFQKKPNFCPNCGEKTKFENKFCPNCGNKF